MSMIEKYLLGTIAPILTTELNALANNSLAISAAYNNVVGGGDGDGYPFCEVELVVTYDTAPADSTGCSVWFLAAPDDTDFEDGGSSTTPARFPDVVIPVRPVTTAQRITRRVGLPPGLIKVLLKNDGTGQSLASTGNTLKIRPYTRQVV